MVDVMQTASPGRIGPDDFQFRVGTFDDAIAGRPLRHRNRFVYDRVPETNRSRSNHAGVGWTT